ncbi:MAG: ABC transporter ATP-binding protein [Myxococcaceae bacterium]
MSRPTLEASKIEVRFGGLSALDGVDLSLAQGEVLGLIGPNGAGKTTLVNVLSGFEKPSAGKIFLGKTRLNGLSPHRVARQGVVRTFQAVRVFGTLSALENVQISFLQYGLSYRQAELEALRCIKRLDLCDEEVVPTGLLAHGDRVLVGLARALGARPRFLLLDEPAAGLNETEIRDLHRAIQTVRREYGCGILLIDHNMQVVMQLSDRIQVLAEGRTLAVGRPAEIRSSPAVRRAYLGTE